MYKISMNTSCICILQVLDLNWLTMEAHVGKYH